MQNDYTYGGPRQGKKEAWDTAQICLNGHVITTAFEDFPDHRSDYCPACGEKTIHACTNCNVPIRGHLRGAFGTGNEPVKPYCHNCGKPFPWTERALAAAKELAEESALSEADQQILTESIRGMTSDTANTPLAASRFKKLVAKAGPVVGEAIRKTIVDVISESAKKMAGL